MTTLALTPAELAPLVRALDEAEAGAFGLSADDRGRLSDLDVIHHVAGEVAAGAGTFSPAERLALARVEQATE